tara:strand:- start:2049 stop:2231 length:183 start_codon:yes stop_codon:yes gene_type:complete
MDKFIAGFQDQCFQPLSHLSMAFYAVFNIFFVNFTQPHFLLTILCGIYNIENIKDHFANK